MRSQGIGATVLLAVTSYACSATPAMQRLGDARRLTAELHLQFTKAADASNRAVMANDDAQASSFAEEVEHAAMTIQQEAKRLQSLLEGLGFSSEAGMVQEFMARFAEYEALDRTILQLAVENTNVKAQRLSFGPAQEAADAFETSLIETMPTDDSEASWRTRALVATAVAAIREIQAVQAPHIAAADDATMGQLDERMAAAEKEARGALERLSRFGHVVVQAGLRDATNALDRFLRLNAEIVALSRRNTDVRSLGLALNQKGQLTAACDRSLVTLQEALAKRGFVGTR